MPFLDDNQSLLAGSFFNGVLGTLKILIIHKCVQEPCEKYVAQVCLALRERSYTSVWQKIAIFKNSLEAVEKSQPELDLSRELPHSAIFMI